MRRFGPVSRTRCLCAQKELQAWLSDDAVAARSSVPLHTHSQSHENVEASSPWS